MVSRRAIGDVRPSQVVTTFGPGAIVDLQTVSIIVAGIDDWPESHEQTIRDPRLERLLGVGGFRSAMPREGNYFGGTGTVPSYLFPRYQLCPKCRSLGKVGQPLVGYERNRGEVVCKAPGCRGSRGGSTRATMVPAPFVVACPGGHIDDFPWREYVHRGSVGCRERLSLYSVGRTGSISDLVVACECGETRALSSAFGERRAEVLGPCTRCRPWLGPENRDDTTCEHSGDVRVLQRGATNAWFPILRSALALGETVTPVGRALASCDPRHLKNVHTKENLQHFMEFEERLAGLDLEDVWRTLQEMRREGGGLEEGDLLWPEWLALRDSTETTNDQEEFFTEQAEVPAGFENHLARVVRARKLLEVRALVGFTRIEPPGAGVGEELQPAIAPISRGRSSWLPAVEVKGEGVFLELAESAVRAWERRPAVIQRAEAMARKFAEWEEQRGSVPSAFPRRSVRLATLFGSCTDPAACIGLRLLG